MIVTACKKMGQGRAEGPDLIPTEVYKVLGKKGAENKEQTRVMGQNTQQVINMFLMPLLKKKRG